MKKNKVIILIATSLFVYQFVHGQKDSSTTTNLKIETGFTFISLKDRTFSPIVFSGITPNATLGVNKNKKDKTLWDVNVSVSYGDIDYKNKYFSSTYINAELSFNYLTKIKTFGHSGLYFGGQLSSVLNLLDYDGFDSGSWYTAQKLEPVLMCNYSISEKQSITGQFSYPLVSLVSRPSYAGVDEFVVVNSENIPKILYSRTKIYSLNKLINPNIELTYFYSLPKLIWSISAHYDYLQVNSIRKFYKNEFGLNIGLQIKIGKQNEE